MKSTQILALLLGQGILLVVSHPQGGYNSGPPQPAGPPPPPPSSGSAPNFGPTAFAPQQPAPQSQVQISSQALAPAGGGASSFGAFGGGGGGGSPPPAGGSGSNLQVQCQPQQVAPGQFKFVCSGANADAISLKSEHVLWITGDGGQKQTVDIEIPNYKIDELIKAGFKIAPGQGSQINVLLKKPEQTYDAQIDKLPAAGGNPSVNLQYEPVQKTLIHYPNDKPYSPLTGPILPPLAGGRPQRQVVHTRYVKPQQKRQ